MDSEGRPQTDYLRFLLEAYFPIHFFALFRAHELFNVEPFIHLLSPPIMDLGCGDGTIANLLFGRKLDFGVDLSPSALAVASQQGAYQRVLCCDAHEVPLPDQSLGGVFSNCALEHIPDMRRLVRSLSRLLRPGAYMVATCLSPHYYAMNPIFAALKKPGRRWLRQRMVAAENKLQNHVSVLGIDEYRRIFEDNGMSLRVHSYYATGAIGRYLAGWDTASKYVLPYPVALTHFGFLHGWLRLRYGKLTRRVETLERWQAEFHSLCYHRDRSGEPGLAQILVAQKL